MPTEDLQLAYNGLTTGKGTLYGIRSISGLRDFTTRFADEPIATRWGSFVGDDMVESSSIVIEYVFLSQPSTIAALEAAFVPAVQSSPAALKDLSWKWTGEPGLMRQARCRRRSRPIVDTSELSGSVATMLVELQAPDPRAYSVDVHQEALSPSGDDGLALNFTAGSGAGAAIDFTSGSGADVAVNMSGTAGIGPTSVTNAGTTDTFPVVTFSAPAGISHWRLRNLTSGVDAEFAFDLQAGQHMVVDFRCRATPRVGDVVVVDGAARYAAWQETRVPLALAAGTSQLRFDVLVGDSTGAVALVEWQDAYS